MANLTNLNNKFLVTTGGNVGINTTSPGFLLDVYSPTTNVVAQFESGDNQAWISVRDDGYTTYGAMLGCDHDAGLEVILANNAATKRLVIKDGGNVGIGTDSPAQKLDVEGSIRLNSELQIFSSATDIGQISNSGGALNIQGTSTRDVSLGSDTTPQAVFIEGTNGNVGIGTTSPADKLHIEGNLYFGTSNRTIYTGGSANLNFQVNTGEILFLRSNGSNESMRIDSSGNVGIGETSIDARLHVTALASGGISNIKLESPGASKWAFGIPASQTYLAFDETNDNLSTPTMVLTKTTKRLGIGTTTPDEKLVVGTTGGTQNIEISNSYIQSFNRSGSPGYAALGFYASSYTFNVGSLDIHATTGDSLLQFNIDGDTYSMGIDNSDSDKFKLSYGVFGNTDLISIDTSGNSTFVGKILTPANGTIIEAGGADAFGYNSTSGRGFYIRGTGSTYIYGGGKFYTGGAAYDLLYNTQAADATFGGNVGIGTTSPDAKLDVESNHSQLRITDSDDSKFALFSYSSTFLSIRNNSTSAAHFSLDSSGNVGIGTNSPNQTGYSTDSKVVTVKAPVSGGASALELIGLANADGNLAGAINFMSYAETAPLAQITGVRHTSDTAGKLYFKTAGSPVLAMLQDQTAYFYNTLYFSSSGVGSISWGSMGGGTGFGIRGESGRGLSLGSNGAWDKMIIDTNGKVGIGKTNPSTRLDVQGVMTAGDSTTDGAIRRQHQTFATMKPGPSSGGSVDMMFVDHTHSLDITVVAIINHTNVATGRGYSVAAYGSATTGLTQTSFAGNVSALSISYVNTGGSENYVLRVTCTYSGVTAPEICVTATGQSASELRAAT